MALFRMTDAPSKERLSLCVIANLLSQPSLVEERRKFFKACPSAEVKACDQRIEFILSLVPPDWKPDYRLQNTRLAGCREALRPLRDKLIAHALPFDQLKVALSTIDDFRTLVGQLVSAAQWVFKGATPNDPFEARLKEAREFWSYVPSGFAATLFDVKLVTTRLR
jgi:hypothetical protein